MTMKTTSQNCTPTKRDIVYTFMSLPRVLQYQCADSCDLREPEDSLLEGQDIFIKWFQRAQARNLLAVFWEAIQAAKREAD